jgi:hypothetical protein
MKLLLIQKRAFCKKALFITFLSLLLNIAWAGPSPGTATAPYRANVKTLVFHHYACEYYGCKNCTQTFNSRQEAISAGYSPCMVCTP